MTDRAEIERLLNMTGRTLEGLPNSYSAQEVDNRFREIIGGHRFGDFILHQSDVIELLVAAPRDALDNVACAEINKAPTLSLNTLRDEIYNDAVAHGLWEDGGDISGCTNLIEDEVHELKNAAKACAVAHEKTRAIQARVRYREELADVVIMCFSVAGHLGIDIDSAIRRKMAINKERPWKHGKE